MAMLNNQRVYTYMEYIYKYECEKYTSNYISIYTIIYTCI